MVQINITDTTCKSCAFVAWFFITALLCHDRDHFCGVPVCFEFTVWFECHTVVVFWIKICATTLEIFQLFVPTALVFGLTGLVVPNPTQKIYLWHHV